MISKDEEGMKNPRRKRLESCGGLPATSKRTVNTRDQNDTLNVSPERTRPTPFPSSSFGRARIMVLQALLLLLLGVARMPRSVATASTTSEHHHNVHRPQEESIHHARSMDRESGSVEESTTEEAPFIVESHNDVSESDRQPLHHTTDDDILIVATVDGTFAALSKRTGDILWKRTSNISQQGADRLSSSVFRPLVATSTTVQSSSSPADAWRTTAVPSLDGAVYLTAKVKSESRDTTSDNAALDELTIAAFMPDLVGRTPFVDSRNRVFTGSSRTTAFCIDGNTGEVLHESTSGIPYTSYNENNDPMLADRKVVWLGRVDHDVSIFEPKAGALDVKFSTSRIMGSQEMLLGHSEQPHAASWKPMDDELHSNSPLIPTTSKQSFMEEQAKHVFSDSPPSYESTLVVTPNGNVAFRNVATGQLEWVASEAFDTPVAFAVDSGTGLSLKVDVVADAVLPNGSVEYVTREMERQLDLIMTNDGVPYFEDEEDPTIVGSLPTGELFAMPLWKRPSRNPVMNQQKHAVVSTSSSSTEASRKNFHVTSVANQFSGRHSSSLTISQDHFSGSISSTNSCRPRDHSFPKCLANIGVSEHKARFAKGPDGSYLSEEAPKMQNGAIVPFYHPHFHYVPPENHYTLNGEGRARRRRYIKLLRILGSWLPPTIALLFVVSFELGRRRKQKRSSDLNSQTLINSSGQEHETESVGAIQVFDDVILGYGGHGTVVYKGMLDGRPVAVKRMLKAYHASAEREISLLIESDGHPNVVRYFMKEVRGDFVYLALELCDLSLHDLIGTLRNHSDLEDKENHVPDLVHHSTKTILYQISCGVRHLHRSRIVHRDLKPMNILLADSRAKSKRSDDETIFDIYDQGYYIAKISDMGLGKQLAGQSSYGASLIGESSLRGASNGNQSSIAGAGPGSVGWQAPEVMAMRLTSDSSVRSDSSYPTNDGSADSSPMEPTSSRSSRSTDIFSLGCIFYSTLVPGSHPFGEWYEREANIMHNRPNLKALEELSDDAHDLVSSMIERNQHSRPTAGQICDHPFFWPAERRLAFLCDFSDRLEIEHANAEETASSKLAAKLFVVERNAAQVVGLAWDTVLDKDLVNNVQRFRTYDPSSIRDLLRLIRNKHHHFDELPERIKESMGTKSEGLMNHFDQRFPRLLVHCYKVCGDILQPDDPLVTKYSIPLTRRTDLRTVSVAAIPESDHLPAADMRSDLKRLEEEPLSARTSPHAVSVRESSGADEADFSASDRSTPIHDPDEMVPLAKDADSIVIWHGSSAARSLNCRGWSRSDEEWERRVDARARKRDPGLLQCADDPRFRTRLCNHWDMSLGTFCPMRKKGKCIFAHGPVELRVKEGKRHRWGKLVDKNGDNKNPCHSGGEDTFGAARSIETERKNEGKWSTDKSAKKGGRKQKAKKVS